MVQHLVVPLAMTIGILCMVTISRRRSYRRKGLIDPLRIPLLIALVILGALACICMALLRTH